MAELARSAARSVLYGDAPGGVHLRPWLIRRGEGSSRLVRSSLVTLNTVALELVPPNVESGPEQATEDAHKVLRFSTESGITGRIGHVMIPGMIAEEDDRPVAMKPKLDVLDFWSIIKPELPGMKGLCTQVTAFTDEPSLGRRLTDLSTAGIEGIVFVGVPRTMKDGEGSGVAPTDALSIYGQLVPNRGAILIPTREGEAGRFNFKCNQGATFGMTQLLYSDAIVGFLTEFAKNTDHRPEILLSFGFVPKVENRVGLINWLIQDPGNGAVAAEQAFVKKLADSDPAQKRRLMVDLYKRVIDGVADLGYPLSIHLEATYGVSGAAFQTFAEMLAYWSPASPERPRRAV
jgi:Mycobacterial methylenetetrahydrofolate reductase